MAVWYVEGPKLAKRKKTCRRCGRVIARNEEYWLEHWNEGFYHRKQTVCRDCARAVLAAIIVDNFPYRGYRIENIPARVLEKARLLDIDVRELLAEHYPERFKRVVLGVTQP